MPLFRSWVYLTYACLATSAFAQNRALGSICGNALDERGSVASSVSVAALPIGGFEGPIRGTKTDEHGHYCIAGVNPGRYVVTAADEKKGYPLLLESFYFDSQAGSTANVVAQSVVTYDFRIPY